jgi:hypothetical protein
MNIYATYRLLHDPVGVKPFLFSFWLLLLSHSSIFHVNIPALSADHLTPVAAANDLVIDTNSGKSKKKKNIRSQRFSGCCWCALDS